MAFSRIADAICWLCRCLLIIVILHYVDDLGGVHDSSDAQNAFNTFSRFCELLGIRLKPSKAQPPAEQQSLLGVRIQVLPDGVRVSPEPRRIEKLTGIIREALETGELQPEAAARLAGKIAFVNSTAFGRTGATALRPVYARASSTGSDTAALNVGLAAALRALLVLLATMRPRFVPFAAQGSHCCDIHRCLLPSGGCLVEARSWNPRSLEPRSCFEQPQWMGIHSAHRHCCHLRTWLGVSFTAQAVYVASSIHLLLGDLRTAASLFCACSHSAALLGLLDRQLSRPIGLGEGFRERPAR